MNRKGSTSLESLAGLLLILSTMLASGQMARVVTAKIWFDHCLYEALICAAETQSETVCKRIALQKAQRIPLGTQSFILKLQKRDSHWEGEFQWQGALGLKTRAQMKLGLRS